MSSLFTFGPNPAAAVLAVVLLTVWSLLVVPSLPSLPGSSRLRWARQSKSAARRRPTWAVCDPGCPARGKISPAKFAPQVIEERRSFGIEMRNPN